MKSQTREWNKCPGCGADYGKSDAFCRRCGAKVSQPVIQPKVVCPACGYVAEGGSFT